MTLTQPFCVIGQDAQPRRPLVASHSTAANADYGPVEQRDADVDVEQGPNRRRPHEGVDQLALVTTPPRFANAEAATSLRICALCLRHIRCRARARNDPARARALVARPVLRRLKHVVVDVERGSHASDVTASRIRRSTRCGRRWPARPPRRVRRTSGSATSFGDCARRSPSGSPRLAAALRPASRGGLRIPSASPARSRLRR